MRAVLDDDVAYRAGGLTRRGVQGLLADMHPELSVDDDLLRIDKRRHPDHHESHDLTDTGMLLVPSVFVWPHVLFAASACASPSLTYPARGIGNLWTDPGGYDVDDIALGALLGRTRAVILISLDIPRIPPPNWPRRWVRVPRRSASTWRPAAHVRDSELARY